MKQHILRFRAGLILCSALVLILASGYKNLSLAMDPEIWNLPIPQGSQITWKDQPMELNGIRAPSTRFLVAMSTDEIMAFYKSALLKDKWEELGALAGLNMIGFTKENRFIYIAVFDSVYASKKDVYVIKSPCSLAVCYTLKDKIFQDKLAADMPGKDFPDILRYPGSKRRMSFLIPIEADFLLYEAQASPGDIAVFYQKVLKDDGWQEDSFLTEDVEKVVPKEYKDKFAVLNFSRDKDSLVINIISAFDLATNKVGAKSSMIMISRNPGKMMVAAGGGK